MNFRYDINGLRAIAVISVVLFHFNPNWVPGGFVGVDVFFVISGFLMTGIILRGFERDSFNLFKFYVSRANRIIPALTIICLILLIFGWFFLTPFEYRALGKHVAKSMVFSSNITYLHEAGYFDVASHKKWLLHTWSLSVEWQFYIIYPLALMVLKRLLPIRYLKRLLILATVCGFLYCVITTIKWPDLAYYLLQTRAWELMLGGIAYCYPLSLKNTQKKLVAFTGIIFILCSCLFISSTLPWPGYWAFFPVIGTYLAILANCQNSLITSNFIFQRVGKWSYSIYLWHWPIVVFIHTFGIEYWWFAGLLVSVLMGWLSFTYIESMRLPSYTQWRDLLKLKPVWAVVVVHLLAVYVYKTSPNQYLFPIPDSVMNSIERKPYECFDQSYLHEAESVVCQLTEGRDKILVVGDSHAYASLPAVEQIAHEQELALYYTGYSGCPPLIGVSPIRDDQERRNCSVLNKRAIQFAVHQHVKTVFLAARWTYYTEGNYEKRGIQYLSMDTNQKDRQHSIESLAYGLNATLKYYADHDIDVILMLQVPMQEHNPDDIYTQALDNNKLSLAKLTNASISLLKNVDFQRSTNQIISDISKRYDNVKIIDPSDVLCHQQNCPVGNLQYSYYFDDDHLSTIGSGLLSPLIKQALLN